MGLSFQVGVFFSLICFCLYKEKLLFAQYKQFSFENFMVPPPPASSTDEKQQMTLKIAQTRDYYECSVWHIGNIDSRQVG